MNGLREEYFNAKTFYDEDIFRHFWRAHLAGNTSAKAKWLSKLSKTKIRDIGLLEKRAAKDPQTQHLQSVFDELLPFTGLWPALQIKTFHRLLLLRCPKASFPILLSRHLLITCAGNDKISDTDQNYMGIHTWGRGTPTLSGCRYSYNTRGTMPKSLGQRRAPAPKKKNHISSPPSLYSGYSLYWPASRRSTTLYHPSIPFSKTPKSSSLAPRL